MTTSRWYHNRKKISASRWDKSEWSSRICLWKSKL